MKTRTTTIAALLAALLLAVAAAAQPGPAPRGDAPDGFRCGRMCEKLDLTDAQKDAVAKIREQAAAAQKTQRKEMARLRNELQGIMLQDDPDAKAAEKVIREMGDLRTEQRVRAMQTRLAIRAQLTPEQRDKLPLMGDGFGGFGGGGRHGGHGGRGFDDGCRGRGGCPAGAPTPGCSGDGPHGSRGR